MRLFVAIELEEDARAAVARCQSELGRRDGGSGVRWTRADNVHLTLRFLGDVADADVVKVSEAVASSARNVAPFTMRLTGIGCFPPGGKVRIVWTGVEENSGELARLVANTESAVVALGFAPEARPYRPHLTIGRVKDDRSRGDLRRAIESYVFDGVDQPVDRIVVMASELSRSGPTYTVVSAHPIGGP